jgi:hypothetical protein
VLDAFRPDAEDSRRRRTALASGPWPSCRAELRLLYDAEVIDVGSPTSSGVASRSRRAGRLVARAVLDGAVEAG